MIGGTSVKAFPVPPLPSLAEMAEGTLVKMNESGAPVEFYVAKHDYESELNGAGRTLVVRKDCYDNRTWGGMNFDDYDESSIDAWLNEEYKIVLDSWLQSLIGTTTFYCDLGNRGDTLERAVFLLSVTELGKTGSSAPVEGAALPIASTLSIAYLDGEYVSQWTRTAGSSLNAWYLTEQGSASSNGFRTTSRGSRPVFTLPSTLKVDENMNVIGGAS